MKTRNHRTIYEIEATVNDIEESHIAGAHPTDMLLSTLMFVAVRLLIRIIKAVTSCERDI